MTIKHRVPSNRWYLGRRYETWLAVLGQHTTLPRTQRHGDDHR